MTGELWACPYCHLVLRDAGVCTDCARTFPQCNGLPDLRVPDEMARRLAAQLRTWQEVNRQLAMWRRRRTPAGRASGEENLAALLQWVKCSEGPLADIGCKDGRLAQHFPRLSYYGIDPYVQLPAGEGVAWGTAEFLPLADAAFAQACSLATLDYFLDPAAAMAEVKRILRPGGVFWGCVGLWPDDYAVMYDARRAYLRSLTRRTLTLAESPRLLYKHWRRFMLMPRMYMSYFTEATLRALLAREFAGLRLTTRAYDGGTVAWFAARKEA